MDNKGNGTKRTNSPEVIARANAARNKRNAEAGLVRAQPSLIVKAEYRDQVRDAGLAAMKQAHEKLQQTK